MNDLVRAMAEEERVLVADIHADFTAQADLEGLFVDHVHPNDSGYQLMARTWWRAITGTDGATASRQPLALDFGFAPPGAR
jgi:lysophospholipase L1-like esterase